MTHIPSTMNGVILTGHGGLDKLVYRTDLTVPQPQSGQVLINVKACGLNNTDINTRTGWYSRAVTSATDSEGSNSDEHDATWGGAPITFPRIQGADIAGYVVALGAGADPALLGKRVMVDTWLRDWDDPQNKDKTAYLGSEVDGGYAEYLAINMHQVHPIECDLSDAELATFATSYVTAENMLARANVGAGDSVLITGASGGVGSALIQLAKRRKAQVIALSTKDKAEALREVGADYVLDRHQKDLSAAVQSATGTPKVSVVADVVGGDIFPQLLEVLERGGRYTGSGAIAGPMVNLDLRTFYLNDLTLTGATIIPPTLFADLVGYIERKEIRPLLAACFPLKKLRDAQSAFVAKKHIGNIVVAHDA